MSEKSLTELEWKKFARGRSLKDTALMKALGALETARQPEARLAALDEIEKQADVLRKASKADKEVTAYLGDIDKALPKARKLAEFDAQSLAKEASRRAGAESEASEDEGEESPALLTGKMIPLLREVKSGELVLQALIAIAGKETVVLVSRTPISPARGKLLKDQMKSPGGLKFIRGECLFEAGALTFVVQAGAGGLARRIKDALLAQTDMRHKVRVRGENPNDVDDDGEPLAGLNESGQSRETETETETEDAGASFNQRLSALMPRIKEALVAAGPQAADLKLKVSEAGVAARQKDFGSAHGLLDDAETLLAGPGGEGRPPTATTATTAPGPGGFSKVAFEKIHLDWEAGKKTVQARLAALNQAILAEWNDAEAQTAAARLDKILARFNEGLSDVLDQLRNAELPAERSRLGTEAGGIAQRYLAYLATDPLVAHVDENPFEIAIAAQALLSVPLTGLQKQLSTLVKT